LEYCECARYRGDPLAYAMTRRQWPDRTMTPPFNTTEGTQLDLWTCNGPPTRWRPRIGDSNQWIIPAP
jgi:hypothetical protein